MRPDDELCGFDDCNHPFALHIELVRRNGGSRWACQVDGCHCIDFAQPGSVMKLGTVGLELGDIELN